MQAVFHSIYSIKYDNGGHQTIGGHSTDPTGYSPILIVRTCARLSIHASFPVQNGHAEMMGILPQDCFIHVTPP